MRGWPNPTLDWTELGPKEVVFSFDDENPNRTYHFAVERLEKYLVEIDHPIRAIAVDPEWAKTLPVVRGLEPHRLVRLLEAPEKWTPVIFCEMPDKSGLLVDGNHRYYITWQAGGTSVPAYFVPMKIWNQYLVKFPFKLEASTIGWSGIP